MKVRTQDKKCYMIYKGGYVKEDHGKYKIMLLFPNGSSVHGGTYYSERAALTVLEELDSNDNNYSKRTYYMP